MSRKQINIPKVLDFNWLKSENLAETKSALKHQKLKKLLELTGNAYPDLVKVEDSWVILKGKDPQEERGASNLNNEDGDEAIPMEDDTVQAAAHSCYVIHHSYEQEPSVEHAGSQRISSPSIEIRVDSPAPQSVHEEAAATHQNAIVAYQTPKYRGEPLSMFERQVLYLLDAMTAEQRAYFETTQAKFQHLDDQIEGVQLQLAELYYKD